MQYDPEYGDCGPECRATQCCKNYSEAARRLCGCMGALNHDDCPEPPHEKAARYEAAAVKLVADALTPAGDKSPVCEDDDGDVEGRVEYHDGGAWVRLLVWVDDDEAA